MTDQINLNAAAVDRIIKLELYINTYKKICKFHEEELSINYDAIKKCEEKLIELRMGDC